MVIMNFFIIFNAPEWFSSKQEMNGLCWSARDVRSVPKEISKLSTYLIALSISSYFSITLVNEEKPTAEQIL